MIIYMNLSHDQNITFHPLLWFLKPSISRYSIDLNNNWNAFQFKVFNLVFSLSTFFSNQHLSQNLFHNCLLSKAIIERELLVKDSNACFSFLRFLNSSIEFDHLVIVCSQGALMPTGFFKQSSFNFRMSLKFEVSLSSHFSVRWTFCWPSFLYWKKIFKKRLFYL